MAREAPVVERMYQFLRWLLERINKFPRSQRFVLGDRMENTALDILELLIEANYSQEKRELLRRANLQLQKLRFLIRLAKDGHYLSVSQYEFSAQALNEIGSQIGGWLKEREKQKGQGKQSSVASRGDVGDAGG